MSEELNLEHIEKRLSDGYSNIMPKTTRLHIMRQDIRQLIAEVKRVREARDKGVTLETLIKVEQIGIETGLRRAALGSRGEEPLKLLVEKWRAVPEGDCACDSCQGFRGQRRDCADELEAALRGVGTPQAWQDISASQDRSVLIPVGTPQEKESDRR